MACLFISYRRSCKDAVLAAKAALEAAGVDVWLDLEAIDLLADFPTRICTGIAESHAALVWWSADYAESDICMQEFRLAWQHARRHSSDVARRVWMLNPEPGGGHIFAGELNASNFLTPPAPGGEAAWAESLKSRLDALLSEGPLADERHAETAPPIHGAPSSSREFTGRGAELMRIHSALFPPLVRAVAAGVAVQTHGLGGIGKTELAARYVSDFAIAYPAGVLWLNLAAWQPPQPATEADAHAAWLRALDAALANAPALWRELALDAKGKPRPASEVRENLARHFDNAKPALVVLDNLPELSPIDARRRILDFLAAPGPQGKTLVTTRDARPVDGYAPLPLTVLGPDDALRLLARYRPAQATAEREAMAALVDEVGGHTQALVLLGERYQEDAGGYPRALQHLREQGHLPRIEAIAASLRDELGDKARGIVAALSISFEPLTSSAREVLGIASLCAPSSPIRDAMLFSAFQEYRSSGHDGISFEDGFAAALRSLLRASLIERRGQTDALQVHPLVAQAAFMVPLTASGSAEVDEALLASEKAVLRVTLSETLLERFLPKSTAKATQLDLTRDAVHAYHAARNHYGFRSYELWFFLGIYEERCGQFLRAMTSFEASIPGLPEEPADGVPTTTTAMQNLGEIHRQLGNFEEALAFSEKVLSRRSETLGAEHPATLAAINNFGGVLLASGDAAGACRLLRPALDTATRTLGEDHKITVTLLNGLIYSEAASAGHNADARPLNDLVTRCKKVFGMEHRTTLMAMANLAGALLDGECGPADARRLLEQVLPAQATQLGKEHSETTMSAWYLFRALRALDEHDQALVVAKRYLFWLAEHEVATLSVGQRTIRGYVRKVLGLDPD